MKFLSKLFKPKYTYGSMVNLDGSLRDGDYRYNNKTNNVEFILWKKGEHHIKEDYWYRMGDGWSEWFIAESNPSEEDIKDKVDSIKRRINV